MARFHSTKDLIGAYPTLLSAVSGPVPEMAATPAIEQLMAEDRLKDAVALCAYALDRREAVWWACQSLRRVQSRNVAGPEAAIAVAEGWVRDPTEARAAAALRFGERAEQGAPAVFAALAAGWAGAPLGFDEQGPIRAPAHLTAEASRAACLSAGANLDSDSAPRFFHDAIEHALAMLRERGSA